MYAHKVPQYLELEDKFLLGLTMRQCVIVIVGCCLSYEVWTSLFLSLQSHMLAWQLGLLAVVLVMGSTLAVAFVRIYQRGLEEWGLVLLLYLVAPKVYLWRFNRLDAFEQLDARARRADSAASGRQEEDAW